MPRILLCMLLLPGGCVYFSDHTPPGACGNDLGSPIRNFCVVAPGVLWRGQRPTSDDANWLLAHGVGTIVGLGMDDGEAIRGASPNAQRIHSLYYLDAEFGPLEFLSQARLDHHVERFLAILKQAPKPVYLHCRAGIDRTGVLSAAYQVLVQGASPEQAIAEMARYHTPWIKLSARYVRSLAPAARRAEILKGAGEYAARLQPTARIECEREHCGFAPAQLPAGSGGESLADRSALGAAGNAGGG